MILLKVKIREIPARDEADGLLNLLEFVAQISSLRRTDNLPVEASDSNCPTDFSSLRLRHWPEWTNPPQPLLPNGNSKYRVVKDYLVIVAKSSYSGKLLTQFLIKKLHIYFSGEKEQIQPETKTKAIQFFESKLGYMTRICNTATLAVHPVWADWM